MTIKIQFHRSNCSHFIVTWLFRVEGDQRVYPIPLLLDLIFKVKPYSEYKCMKGVVSCAPGVALLT